MQIVGELTAYCASQATFYNSEIHIYMDNYIDPVGMDYLFPSYTDKYIDLLGMYPVDISISETEL